MFSASDVFVWRGKFIWFVFLRGVHVVSLYHIIVLLKRGPFAGPVVKFLPLRLNLLYHWQKRRRDYSTAVLVTTPPDKSDGFSIDLSAASYETPEQVVLR